MPTILTPDCESALRQLVHALNVLDDVDDGIERYVTRPVAVAAVGVARHHARQALAAAVDAREAELLVHQGGLEVVDLTPYTDEDMAAAVPVVAHTGAVLA